MAITTLDGLVNAMPGQFLPYTKTFTGVANGYLGMWMVPGLPGPGVAPTSGINGDIPTDASPGPHVFNNPTVGQLTYIGRVAMAAQTAAIVGVYDRLWHNTYNVTSTAAQAITQPALNRGDTTGEDVELWWMAYAAMGAGNTSITVTYTNSQGTAGRVTTSTLVGPSFAQHRMVPLPLAAGDTGVRSVQSLTINASHASGTAGIALRRRIMTIPIPAAGTGIDYDPFMSGMPIVSNDAAIDISVFTSTATAGTLTGELCLLQG